jgi:hypothetical protein
MNAPTADATTAQKLLSAQSDADTEINNLVEQETPNSLTQIDQRSKQKIETDAERILSSIARLTSTSIGELEELTSELQKLDEFLKSETGRVQREIESVLAGIKIIVEAITPWRRPSPASSGATRATPVGASSYPSASVGNGRRGG